ncbi:unnamed protein product [Clavelina lepadiformis]|uniref:Uncharacterized protein n=1 Tax=Clavelina lepadiformis TaxID=159417 RepID=A0ABP0H3E3_CLALP
MSDPRSGRRVRAEEISERTLVETLTKIKKKLKYGEMGTATANTIFPVGHPDHRASSDASVETPSESKETRTHEFQFQTLNIRATVQAVHQSLYDVTVPNFRSYV